MINFMLFAARRYGHTEHMSGFSGAFSWWRSASDPLRRWAWCGHEYGFAAAGGYAVTDDFGNLVAVQS